MWSITVEVVGRRGRPSLLREHGYDTLSDAKQAVRILVEWVAFDNLVDSAHVRNILITNIH